MDNNNQSQQPEQTDLSSQYNDILEKYSQQLAATSQEPAPEPKTFPLPPLDPTPILPPPSEPTPIPVMPSTPTYEPVFVPPVDDISPPIPQKSSNFFKILFFISLLIFLGVAGAIAYTLFFQSKPKVSLTLNPSPTESNTNTPTPSGPVCQLNDKTYTVGETFPATDGCNSCTCDDKSLITCTEKVCPTPTTLVLVGPLKTILTSLNAQFKTKYIAMTPDNGKKWTVDLTKSSNKTNILTIKKVITDYGLILQADKSGEAGPDWKETYSKNTDICELNMTQSVLTLSCQN